jgi:hypothetical protein
MLVIPPAMLVLPPAMLVLPPATLVVPPATLVVPPATLVVPAPPAGLAPEPEHPAVNAAVSSTNPAKRQRKTVDNGLLLFMKISLRSIRGKNWKKRVTRGLMTPWILCGQVQQRQGHSAGI